MLYPYMTLADGTEVSHSQVVEDDGTPSVYVHFERPTKDGFDSARCELPSYAWTQWEGSFSPEDKAFFTKLLENNAHLIFRYAKTGGIKIA